MKKLLECVPNFSEGRNMDIIEQIALQVSGTDGVKLLNVDPGKATNRTVITFVGEPEQVIEAAFRAIRKAAELIDMTTHHGEHPRMGATDVCPLIPVSGITMEEAAEYARKLAERVGKELNIPVYLYEYAQPVSARKNLSVIRAGEYEGFFSKIKQPEWKPDFGPSELPAKSGATVIGARDFLIAYNVNLNTTSVRRANSVAFDVRENGRNIINEKGEKINQPGTCKSIKAIGWYIEEYGIAQVSMNLTNIRQTPLHVAFDECVKSAHARGMRVTGSELIGLIPLSSMLEAGKYFLGKQQRSVGVSEKELINIAVKSLGLDELTPFKAEERIIEYMLKDKEQSRLVSMSLAGFADETASESPAPGGGSVAAYLGSLGAALASMVANLSAGKKGWENSIPEFSQWAEKGQELKDKLLRLVDEDTLAFSKIMNAYAMPKNTDADKQARSAAIQSATKYAIEVPYMVMELACSSFEIIRAMAEKGNPNSISDAGVAALCARSAVLGAHLNVKINASSLTDKSFASGILHKADQLAAKAVSAETEILSIVNEKLNSSK